MQSVILLLVFWLGCGFSEYWHKLRRRSLAFFFSAASCHLYHSIPLLSECPEPSLDKPQSERGAQSQKHTFSLLQPPSRFGALRGHYPHVPTGCTHTTQRADRLPRPSPPLGGTLLTLWARAASPRSTLRPATLTTVIPHSRGM